MLAKGDANRSYWVVGTRARACTLELTRTVAIAALRGSPETVVSPTERRVVS